MIIVRGYKHCINKNPQVHPTFKFLKDRERERCTFRFRDVYIGDKTIKKITEMIITEVRVVVSSVEGRKCTVGMLAIFCAWGVVILVVPLEYFN